MTRRGVDSRLPGRWIGLAAILCLLSSATAGQDAPVSRTVAEWGTVLRSQDLEARRQAAIETRSADKATQVGILPVLIELLLGEKDGQVRLAVLDTVTDMGLAAEAATPALLHTLRTDYGGKRQEETHQDYRSALALAAVGAPAVEGLRGLLNESAEKVRTQVRAEAAMALGRIGPQAADAAPDLIRLLGDENGRVREEAARALGRMDDSVIEPLLQAAKREEVSIRAGAIAAIGQMSATNSRAIEAVISAAAAPEPELRAVAIRSLANLQVDGLAMRDVLVANVQHSDETVRTAAVNVLVSQRDLLREFKPQLVGLLSGDDKGVAWHAAFLLQEIGLEAAPDLLEALRQENSRIDQIAQALAYMGSPVTGLLTRAVADPEPRVRQGAALALGQIRPVAPETASLLASGLEDADAGVQSACLKSIGRLGALARVAVPAVRTKLRDESPPIREQAISILFDAAPRDEQLIDDMIGMLHDQAPDVRRRAIDTIRSAGPLGRRALPDVVAMLDDPDARVTSAAAAMIGSHGPAAADAVPALVELLDSASPQLRLVVTQTLSQLGEAALPAWDRLVPLLEDENGNIRAAAIQTVGNLNLDAERVRPYLVRAFSDSEEEVRSQAFRSVRRLGRRGAIFIPDLIRLAGDKELGNSVQRSLERYEENGPDPRSLPELIELLGHDADPVKLLAIKFIRLAGPAATEAVADLERLNRDAASEEVRAKASEAIEHIKNGPAPDAETTGNPGP